MSEALRRQFNMSRTIARGRSCPMGSSRFTTTYARARQLSAETFRDKEDKMKKFIWWQLRWFTGLYAISVGIAAIISYMQRILYLHSLPFWSGATETERIRGDFRWESDQFLWFELSIYILALAAAGAWLGWGIIKSHKWLKSRGFI